MSSEKPARPEKSACEEKPSGRPRCPVRGQAILAAARELLEESGFAKLTMEGVAARAGVGKTTVYRRWPNKAGLAMDALFEEGSPSAHFPDTGDVRADIRRLLRQLVRELNGPLGRKIAALLASAQFDEELAEAFRSRWIEPRRAAARQVIERGIRRGEIRRKVDPDVLLDALYGSIYFRLLRGDAPLTPGYADALVELVMSGLDR